jgi:glycosyltransferase involved in cell wall biosynthesis
MKVVHVITGLDVGGAEMMLYQLLAHIDRTQFDLEVISLTDIGLVGQKIQSLGVPVRALGMNRNGLPSPMLIPRLARWLREMRPQVVQTWMYHADLLGTLAAHMAGRPPVIWNIQYGGFDAQRDKKRTVLVAKACARLSHRGPMCIVSCAVTAKKAHAALGYADEKIKVIPNAADVAAFYPNEQARREVRQELGIDDAVPLIGMVGRFDPQKDHHNFVQAAVRLYQSRPDVQYLLCGLELSWENTTLAAWIPLAIRDRFHLLGRRQDVARLGAALDIGSLSSAYGEGFPMALNELMACGIPCAATDVGDCALLIGETGRIVPPRDPQALANALRELVGMNREDRGRLGRAARERVETHFSILEITAQYEALYREVTTKYMVGKTEKA